MQYATFGGGCFWCLEAVFQNIRGIASVVSGYAGGHTENPTYEEVLSGKTGHAEVVQIHFDPDVISYEQLLQIFFEVHDPTTPNRQGNDIGPQYRSIILYHNEQQKHIAETTIKRLDASGRWNNPIVTEIAPLTKFYPAEEYHQDYFRNHPNHPYCRLVILPKVWKFQKIRGAILQDESSDYPKDENSAL